MPPAPLPAYDKQIHHWRLSKNILGSGTTSTVVRATHAEFPTLCAAVKIISRSGLLAKARADPSALHLVDSVIRHEVLLMKVAQHERVLKLYDFITTGDLTYIVMEYAPQKTLFDLFRASSSYFPRSLVTHIFSQFLQGLAYAHDLHIVHRDLKLENIFVFGPDIKTLLKEDTAAYVALNVKIGDFGLAHVEHPGVLSTVFHGSPHYQAPEVWLRLPHHAFPTDIWSAGVVLYALICRRLPFDLAVLKGTTLPLENDRIFADSKYDPLKRRAEAQGGEPYMLYDVPEILSPAADTLLRKIFAYNSAVRPTARGMLWDIFFDGPSRPCEQHCIPDKTAVVLDSRVELYDLATLCVPPGHHVSRGSFPGSALERSVKDMLSKPDDANIGKQWAKTLSAYERGKDAWEASVEAQVADNGRKKYTKSLGRKNKALEILGQRDINIAIPRPKLTGSLSFNSLRFKAVLKRPDDATPRNVTVAPPSPSSTVAGGLQDRREALLRQAFQLGFGTADLRAFADEADMIVRVAREGNWHMSLQEIAREVERRAAGKETAASERLMVNGSPSPWASVATTLVPEM